jgi:GNAT superfamily N-acetyltransferase
VAEYIAAERVVTYNTTIQVEVRRATRRTRKPFTKSTCEPCGIQTYVTIPASVIDRLASTLPERVASKLEEWHAYIAAVDGRIVGTGSLNGQTVSSVFVHPNYEGQGIGAKLMDAIEGATNIEQVSVLYYRVRAIRRRMGPPSTSWA